MVNGLSLCGEHAHVIELLLVPVSSCELSEVTIGDHCGTWSEEKRVLTPKGRRSRVRLSDSEDQLSRRSRFQDRRN